MLIVECKICGKKMEWCGLGRKKLYCSDSCKRRANREHINEYRRKRYATDEAFRKERNDRSSAYAKKRRIEAKKKALARLTDEICNAASQDEVQEILERKLWRKS